MFTTKIDDKTLGMIAEMGDRIASDVDKLENLIWLVKAQAVAQLGDVSRRYAEAQSRSQTTSQLLEELHQATLRLKALDRFWSAEVAMRNRAVHFGNLENSNNPGWIALCETMAKYLAGLPASAVASDAELASARSGTGLDPVATGSAVADGPPEVE